MGAEAGKYNRQVHHFVGHFVSGLRFCLVYVCLHTGIKKATVTRTIKASQRDSDVLEWLVGRFNYKPLPKHDFSLWTLDQPKFELNFSLPNIRGISWKTSAAC